MLDIGWNTAPVQSAAADLDEDVFETLKRRLAEVADPDAPSWEGRERFPLMRKDWDYLTATYGPLINHVPTVTVFKGRQQTVLTGPLEADARWTVPPELGVDREAGWIRFMTERDKAAADADMNAWMRFASRIDIMDEEDTGPTRGGEIPEHVLQKMQRPAKDRAAIRERLQRFTYTASFCSIAGRRYESFSETFVCPKTGRIISLRSKLNIVGLELFNKRLPKNAEYGNDKTRVVTPKETGIEPIFLRDQPYITIGYWTVRGQIAVDLDNVWPDLATLRKELLKALGPQLFPNVIVYRLNAAGEVENPHLIWILPPDFEVGVCGKSRSKPVRTYNMVQRALTSHLIPLGADVGYLNVGKVKNPLSPYWSIACSDENFCTLQDFIDHLPTVSTNEKEMRRRAAKLRGCAVEDLPISKRDYHTVTEIFRAEITAGFRSKCAEFTAARESETAFRAWAEKHVVPRVLAVADTFEIRSILKRQIDSRSVNRPSRRTRQYDGDNRFRDLELYNGPELTGAELPEARKKQGDNRKKLAGTITSANRGAASRAIMHDQVALFERVGGDLNDEAAVASWIIKSGKLGKSTVYKWLEVVLIRFRDASRYIAKPDTHIDASPVIQEPEVTSTSEPRDPAIETSESTLEPASGGPSEAKPTASGPKTDPARRLLRDIDDDPDLRAVEIMRLYGAAASAHRRRAFRPSAPPVSRTLH
ncbi:MULTISPECIES: replication initiation protein [Bradyrhizobium]|uniref:replication initiation protein n=1 Tax=Bradyrhizobium TaxID=374 RepID=UPI001EDA0729|nr:replication initiation protein [Bradyrhizobium zhengyangense]MCG2645196.1 replication initiation protein [Bradyrhizobium zhengyangense]